MQDPIKQTVNFEMWQFEANYKEKLQDLMRNMDASKTQFGAYLKERMSALVAGREDHESWAVPAIHTNAKECYHQLYKTSWQEAQVHFELLNKGAFPPDKLQVVLHTQERKMMGKTEKLYSLENEVSKKSFPISYESEKDFCASMDRIFAELGNVVNQYTEIIDIEIAKFAAQK